MNRSQNDTLRLKLARFLHEEVDYDCSAHQANPQCRCWKNAGLILDLVDEDDAAEVRLRA